MPRRSFAACRSRWGRFRIRLKSGHKPPSDHLNVKGRAFNLGPALHVIPSIAGLGNWFAKGRDCECCSLQRSRVGFKWLRPTSEMHPQAIAFFHAFEALPAEISALENEGGVRLRAGEARHPRSQTTATPIASAFPQSTIDRPIKPPVSASPPFSYVDGPKFGNVFVRWQHIPVLVPLQFSHKRAPMRETLIGVDEGSGQLRPYVRPVVRRSPRPSWVCAGVSGTDLDSVLKAQENGRYCPSCS